MFDIPCKKCLVQAVCRERCDEFRRYGKTPMKLKSVGAGAMVCCIFSSITASYREDLIFLYVFIICAIVGMSLMIWGIIKEKKYLNAGDEFCILESDIFRKYGVRMPMNRRVR